MLPSLARVSGLCRIRGPATVAISSVSLKAMPCCLGSVPMWLKNSISIHNGRSFLLSQAQSNRMCAASKVAFTSFRHCYSDANAKHKLDMKVLEKHSPPSVKVLYTYDSKKETIFYNIVAFVLFGFITYGSYRIYTSEDDDVVDDTSLPIRNFVPFYKQYGLDSYKTEIAAGVFASAFIAVACILRHTLRCARSLVLLQDGETLAVSTYTLFGSTRTRNIPRMQLRTENLNFLLDDYESCFLIRKGQLISYILDLRGTVHDPSALKAAFSHSDDDTEVPPTERMI